MAEMTPMMRKYVETKEQYPDCILFYRLGDFYEMFFEDALTASRELEITLTGKDCGLEERAPMCGVPYHAVENYLGRLVSKGYKVAICEQMEDPKQAKGLVRREVVRIVTPGTNLNLPTLEENKNNFLMCIAYFSGKAGISAADVTTGDYYLTEVEDNRKLMDEIIRYSPSEIICNDAFLLSGMDLEDLKGRLRISISSLEPHYFDEALCRNVLLEHFHVGALSGLGVEEFPNGMIAAGALLSYLYETQKIPLSHFTHIEPYLVNRFMLLDSSTRRNLELTETLREKNKRGSLLWVLDKTKTAMGARMMRSFLEQPLVKKAEMEERLDAVEAFCKDPLSRDEIREYLNPVYDLERLLGKVSYKTANPRDLIAFRSSMEMLPPIKTVLRNLPGAANQRIEEEIDGLEDLCALIRDSIEEEPPVSIREGGMIREGYNEDVDNLRRAKTEGKTWLAELENTERERTGIKNLKIKYNNILGYFIEVPSARADALMKPDSGFIHRQTMSGNMRFTTARLIDLDNDVRSAAEKSAGIEAEIITTLTEKIRATADDLLASADLLAELDVWYSLADVANKYSWVRPNVTDDVAFDIVGGRHPVIDYVLRARGDSFVKNDCNLNVKSVALLTGPNMAGKSTYLRQNALLVVLAHMGSFVPAVRATIGVCDQLFSRVGASDNLAAGQSTFMVEMSETANILHRATKQSFIIFDEIGRGTSTYDGMAIAQAVLEYLNELQPRTLFATHYHELTALVGDGVGQLQNVACLTIDVREHNNEIIFMHKIVAGVANRSYGIQVAKMAGMPASVVARAEAVLSQLESKSDVGTRDTQPVASAPAVSAPENTKTPPRVAQPKSDKVQLNLFG